MGIKREWYVKKTAKKYWTKQHNNHNADDPEADKVALSSLHCQSTSVYQRQTQHAWDIERVQQNLIRHYHNTHEIFNGCSRISYAIIITCMGYLMGVAEYQSRKPLLENAWGCGRILYAIITLALRLEAVTLNNSCKVQTDTLTPTRQWNGPAQHYLSIMHTRNAVSTTIGSSCGRERVRNSASSDVTLTRSEYGLQTMLSEVSFQNLTLGRRKSGPYLELNSAPPDRETSVLQLRYLALYGKCGAAQECRGRGNGRSLRKPADQVASSATIPTCENLGATLLGIEPGVGGETHSSRFHPRRALKKSPRVCNAELCRVGHGRAQNLPQRPSRALFMIPRTSFFHPSPSFSPLRLPAPRHQLQHDEGEKIFVPMSTFLIVCTRAWEGKKKTPRRCCVTGSQWWGRRKKGKEDEGEGRIQERENPLRAAPRDDVTHPPNARALPTQVVTTGLKTLSVVASLVARLSPVTDRSVPERQQNGPAIDATFLRLGTPFGNLPQEFICVPRLLLHKSGHQSRRRLSQTPRREAHAQKLVSFNTSKMTRSDALMFILRSRHRFTRSYGVHGHHWIAFQGALYNRFTVIKETVRPFRRVCLVQARAIPSAEVIYWNLYAYVNSQRPPVILKRVVGSLCFRRSSGVAGVRNAFSILRTPGYVCVCINGAAWFIHHTLMCRLGFRVYDKLQLTDLQANFQRVTSMESMLTAEHETIVYCTRKPPFNATSKSRFQKQIIGYRVARDIRNVTFKRTRLSESTPVPTRHSNIGTTGRLVLTRDSRPRISHLDDQNTIADILGRPYRSKSNNPGGLSSIPDFAFTSTFSNFPTRADNCGAPALPDGDKIRKLLKPEASPKVNLPNSQEAIDSARSGRLQCKTMKRKLVQEMITSKFKPLRSSVDRTLDVHIRKMLSLNSNMAEWRSPISAWELIRQMIAQPVGNHSLHVAGNQAHGPVQNFANQSRQESVPAGDQVRVFLKMIQATGDVNSSMFSTASGTSSQTSQGL
ncbi:hypothetical protein PR048_027883 [Dryococelus australis]|uniref:Uncharacterized protein n=1 Tax=Dryococelus australis TaxID=614101 RepID=A0ABQ9GHS9_9NEOP|nr:hypothetical protein PR048_027883 [Dryococelus australis]